MLDIKKIKENQAEYQRALDRRGTNFDLSALAALYEELGELTIKVEALRAKRNEAAKSRDIEGGKKIAADLAKIEPKMTVLSQKIELMAVEVPNLPLEEVPDGGEADFQVVTTGEKPAKLEKTLDHIQLGTSLDILDMERGAKVASARFYYLKNQAVELEFALIQMVWAILKEKGFEFLLGPQLLNERAMTTAGYLGKARDQVYKTQDDLYLIGTSEASLLAYHMDEVIEVPKRYASFSTCFRREAGSYGKDVKGIIRTHQFDKIEMFSYVSPDDSATEHEYLVAIEEEILTKLEIPYRKIMLAAGDLGAASAKTYDLESWIPSQDSYRETHSCSNCTDWQARRANIRYKKEGKTEYVHTLNGTAIAIGRLLVALWENHQQPDGSIQIPKALAKFTGFEKIEKINN